MVVSGLNLKLFVWLSMRRYEELEVLGNGAFGTVTKCRDRETGEIVAIKKMKQRYSSFDECLQLKEVKSLRKIKHDNVVKLLQVFRENEYLHLVFELLDKSLLKTLTERGSHPEDEVKSIMFQILTGLVAVHRQGFFHRDLKPDNLLWQGLTLKIADFGLAREIRSRPPFTEYCGTRWYRAPEIILRSEFYNSPVDIWSAGVIMAELFLGKPVFQGTSETDQIYKIFGVLGTPTQRTWPDGIRLANRIGIRFPTTTSPGIVSLLPTSHPPPSRSEMKCYASIQPVDRVLPKHCSTIGLV
jgi:protein kinase